MIVRVRCLGTLADRTPASGRLTLPPGATAGNVAALLGFAPGSVATILRNGATAEWTTLLNPDDILSFVPPITGG